MVVVTWQTERIEERWTEMDLWAGNGGKNGQGMKFFFFLFFFIYFHRPIVYLKGPIVTFAVGGTRKESPRIGA